MSRKKPGYDFATNTYYIDDGGCLGMLFGIVIAVVAIGAVINWLKEHVWLMVIAILIIIGAVTVVLYRKSLERKEKEAIEAYNNRHAEKTPEEEAQEIADFIDLWKTQNYPQVEKLKEQYDFVPVIDHEELKKNFSINEFAPQGAEKMLIYLTPPFTPPVIGKGYLIGWYNHETIFIIYSHRGLRSPIIVDVDPGKMLSAMHLENKESNVEDIGDMKIVWCIKKN